jgi:DNA repair exonuclease SbcCD nuclease subunit
MSKRTLYVGDVHATPDDLSDCASLVALISRTAAEYDVKEVVFLGDQYHTHAVMHVEVMAFWQQVFKQLSLRYTTIVLVGNHDRPGDASVFSHALIAHENVVDHIVSEPTVLDGILYLPYCHDNGQFIAFCKSSANLKTVVCHQSFNGGTYENGSYMQDGVDPAVIPQQFVISGHIHSPQKFDKVWYPGAPRWRSLADANVDRAIHVIEHDDDGSYQIKASIDTGTVCRRIVFQTVTPTQDASLAVDSKDRIHVDVRGPEDFVKQKSDELKAKGIRVRKFPDVRRVIKVRESEGIDFAFQKYVLLFAAPNGTSGEELQRVFDERFAKP